MGQKRGGKKRKEKRRNRGEKGRGKGGCPGRACPMVAAFGLVRPPATKVGKGEGLGTIHGRDTQQLDGLC